MADDPEILFEVRGRTGLMTLNRPTALNALTHDGVRAMHARLRDWAGDDRIAQVVIRAVAGRAFCAGGDIRALYDWGIAGRREASMAFFFDEYRLNRFIKRFPKPYIALIDGIVMGGGVGVSVHGWHRIAGPNMVFAMPETGIGFFPDVGATYVLPRCPGETGTWLGLTGARIGPDDALYAGIATQVAGAGRMAGLADEIAVADDVGAVLASLAPRRDPKPALADLRSEIDSVFAADTVEEIVSRLQASGTDFAKTTLKTLAGRPPLSLKVVLRQLRAGRGLDFEACMRLEARLVSRFVDGADFYEGIRAVVVDKDNSPQWSPARLEDVTDDMVEAYFAPLERELDFAG